MESIFSSGYKGRYFYEGGILCQGSFHGAFSFLVLLMNPLKCNSQFIFLVFLMQRRRKSSSPGPGKNV